MGGGNFDMPIDNFDHEAKGQMTIEDYINPVNSMVAVADIFARAKKQMNVFEYKTFIRALAEVKWTEKMDNIIYLDKKELADYCGVHSDTDHLSVHLWEKVGELAQHSFITIKIPDQQFYDSGCFINRITMLKNRVRIKFDDEYLLLFSQLKSGEYITLWADDFLQMDNSENGARAMALYEELRQYSDTRQTNVRGYGVKALKELWNMPKDGKGSYMTKAGHFDRPKFEQKVLEPVLENLAKCKMINLQMQPNGKLYEKVKHGNKVMGYRFYWTISNRPSVATASEVKQISEAVDKNPQILKVAKDIVEGKAKPKPEKKKNGFHNFPQRDYDYDELERMLLQREFNKKD